MKDNELVKQKRSFRWSALVPKRVGKVGMRFALKNKHHFKVEHLLKHWNHARLMDAAALLGVGFVIWLADYTIYRPQRIKAGWLVVESDHRRLTGDTRAVIPEDEKKAIIEQFVNRRKGIIVSSSTSYSPPPAAADATSAGNSDAVQHGMVK